MSRWAVWATSAGFALVMFVPPFFYATFFVVWAIGIVLTIAGFTGPLVFPGSLFLTYLILLFGIRWGAWVTRGY